MKDKSTFFQAKQSELLYSIDGQTTQIEQLFTASLRRYPNQAIPSVSCPALAASESCNAASTNCNASTEEDPKHWLDFHNFLLQRMTAKTAGDRLSYAKQYGDILYPQQYQKQQMTKKVLESYYG